MSALGPEAAIPGASPGRRLLCQKPTLFNRRARPYSLRCASYTRDQAPISERPMTMPPPAATS
jgi:hypothetical protein